MSYIAVVKARLEDYALTSPYSYALERSCILALITEIAFEKSSASKHHYKFNTDYGLLVLDYMQYFRLFLSIY